MPAPTVSLPTTGTDPKVATKTGLEGVINTALDTLWDDIQTRATVGDLRLTRPGETPGAFARFTDGEPDALPEIYPLTGVTIDNLDGIGAVVVLTNVDLSVTPRIPVAVHPGRVYRGDAWAQRLDNGVDPAGNSVSVYLRTLDQDYVATDWLELDSRTLRVSDGIWHFSGTFGFGDVPLADVDVTLPDGTVYVRIAVKAYTVDHITAVAEMTVTDITEIAQVAGSIDVSALADAVEAAEAEAAAAAADRVQTGLDRAAAEAFAPAYYKDIPTFNASPTVHASGTRINIRTGEVFDVVSTGEHFVHPVSGIKLKIVPTNGEMSFDTIEAMFETALDYGDSGVVVGMPVVSRSQKEKFVLLAADDATAPLMSPTIATNLRLAPSGRFWNSEHFNIITGTANDNDVGMSALFDALVNYHDDDFGGPPIVDFAPGIINFSTGGFVMGDGQVIRGAGAGKGNTGHQGTWLVIDSNASIFLTGFALNAASGNSTRVFIENMNVSRSDDFLAGGGSVAPAQTGLIHGHQAVEWHLINLRFAGGYTPCINGTNWWDCKIQRCEFLAGGCPDGTPAVNILDSTAGSNSNNVELDDCRWERTDGPMCKLEGSHHWIIDPKIHAKSNEMGSTPLPAFDLRGANHTTVLIGYAGNFADIGVHDLITSEIFAVGGDCTQIVGFDWRNNAAVRMATISGSTGIGISISGEYSDPGDGIVDERTGGSRLSIADNLWDVFTDSSSGAEVANRSSKLRAGGLPADAGTMIFAQQRNLTGPAMRAYSALASSTAPILQAENGNAAARPALDVYDSSTSGTTNRLATIRRGRATSSVSALEIEAAVATTPDLVFKATFQGNVTADGSFTPGGADYAEWIKTLDGEIPVGATVVMIGGKVRRAKAGEEALVIGVVRPVDGAGIIGNGAELGWRGKYLRDEFDAVLTEAVDLIAWDEMDDAGIEVVRSHVYRVDEVPEGITPSEQAVVETVIEPILNPDFDPDRPYVPRSARPDEWAVIGLHGQLPALKGEPVPPHWHLMRRGDVADRWFNP